MKRFQLFLAFIFISLFSLSSFAWNAFGHMLVATIAYENLQPKARANVDAFLLTFQKEYPEVQTFSQMAYWADKLHEQKIETFTRWHYIDVAFSDDGTALQNLTDTDNALWAVDTMQVVVGNNKANVFERARFLALLTHVVGDLHNPLHTVSRIAKNHPDGDKGGNSFVIIDETNHSSNLHRIWDNGLGEFGNDTDLQIVQSKAQAIMTLYPRQIFDKNIYNLDAKLWVVEGMVNARKYVYSTLENQRPSGEYFETGRKVSDQQVALAGYRLAELLNVLLGS